MNEMVLIERIEDIERRIEEAKEAASELNDDETLAKLDRIDHDTRMIRIELSLKALGQDPRDYMPVFQDLAPGANVLPFEKPSSESQ